MPKRRKGAVRQISTYSRPGTHYMYLGWF